jgi:peroxiredoxin
MMALASARHGEILPGFTLRDVYGCTVSLEGYRGLANLVVVFAGSTIDESPVGVLLRDIAGMDRLTSEAAQVLVVVTSWPAFGQRLGSRAFPMLIDEEGHVHRLVGATDDAGRPAPAVFVTDRFREIFAARRPGHRDRLPGAEEVFEWLAFINIQSSECCAPEWPVRREEESHDQAQACL